MKEVNLEGYIVYVSIYLHSWKGKSIEIVNGQWLLEIEGIQLNR